MERLNLLPLMVAVPLGAAFVVALAGRRRLATALGSCVTMGALIVGAFAEWKVIQLHLFYTVVVTGYFAYSGEGALPCLVRAWEHARSHGQFLQEQALSLNMAYDRYLTSTSEDGKDAQQAMRDMAQACDMSLVQPPRVLGITANGITLMIWRMISVVGIALAIVQMGYWS